MCKPSSQKDPEIRLAELMRRSMNVTVEPHVLRLFLLAEWAKVAALAHAIHDEGKAND